MGRHKVDIFRAYLFGDHNQIAFIFTVFVIHQDDHFAVTQVFDQFFVLTSGGPAGSTNVVVLDLYRQAFERYNFGYASAEATVLFVLILGVTALQYIYSKRFEVTY